MRCKRGSCETTQRQIDLNDEPKKWASFFNSNRMSAKGMGLNYINPIMRNGEQVIELKKEEIEKATEEWKQALILYVVGESPTIAATERYIALQVNTVSKPKVYYHNDGYFLVRFANLDDRNEVLYSGPHMMNNKPIIVKVWSAEFDFNKEVLQTVPIWVKYPNLPLSCWSQDSLSRISSGLGVPLYADECTTKVERISFARVLVEMDVARELPKKLKVEDPNGRVFEQAVQYEWIPEYYTKCMQVGHQCNKEEGNKPKVAPRWSINGCRNKLWWVA
uniref:Endonuclease/exonuclease/phosphatase n=1 Tax=Solanum tuberosum TaxID=4113 RepID=M1BIT4_SOLTU